MVKVGIITYHCAYNYGAILQAYALQTKLKLLGYKTEFINFRPSALVDGYKESSISSGKRAMIYKMIKRKELLHAQNIRKNRYAAFDDFTANFLHLSTKSYSTTVELEEDKLDYNVYICGSDQIWNSKFNGNENAYFLSFVKGNSLKIAYAPSFGAEKISKAECQKVKPLLSDYTALSAREEQGIKIIKEQFHLEATHVLDPTLLLVPEQWMEMSPSNKSMFKQRYVFAYIIGDSDIELKKIYEFAKNENLELIFVGIGSLLQPNLVPYIDKSDVGPKSFMNLLMNADYVCTNSFHGMALSILFNKKFTIIFKESLLNSRMESLLKMCKLEEQKYDCGCTLQRENFEEINFKYANTVIEQERARSVGFLIEAMKLKT